MKAPPRTIMIMAGGTGGHVFPALAVARYLAERNWRVVWLGTRRGMEARLLQNYSFDMVWISFAGMRGKGLLRWLKMPFALGLSLLQSIRAILHYRPQVVLGMGGFTAFPGGLAAWLLRRPLALHEQNSIAGLTNKALAHFSRKIMTGFPGVLASPKTEWVGNPVRHEIAALATPAQRFSGRRGPLSLLVVGGSLGAQALNETVPKAIALLPLDARPEIIHQAGQNQLEALSENYRAAGVSAQTKAFIDDMAAAYAGCDLIICRAGALTVAELSAAGVASILVPFPFAVDDHQTFNAKFLSDRGAAILLPQTELQAEKLAALIAAMTRENLLVMAEKARALAKPDATEATAERCIALAGVRHAA